MRAPIGTDAYMAPEQRAPDGAPRAAGRRLRASRPRVHVALTGAPWRTATLARPPLARAARRARSRDVLRAGLDPDPASRPDRRASSPSALEPLVAALPRRLTLGRRS